MVKMIPDIIRLADTFTSGMYLFISGWVHPSHVKHINPWKVLDFPLNHLSFRIHTHTHTHTYTHTHTCVYLFSTLIMLKKQSDKKCSNLILIYQPKHSVKSVSLIKVAKYKAVWQQEYQSKHRNIKINTNI